MKYLSRSYFKCILIYVGVIFALSIFHWNGAGIFLKSSLAEAAGPSIGIPIDNPGIKKAIEVQDRHVEQLMSIPGVVGVGTGIGANGQPIIRVFTKRAGIPNIPQKIEEISVEKKVTGMFVAYTDPTARFDRPVPIGVSTGHPDITAGTIGCRVTDGQEVYALSNNHVYANANNASIGDPALQPGPFDGGVNPIDAIGQLYDYEPINFSVFGSNTIDAAIVLIIDNRVGNATPSDDGYGTPNSIIWGDSDGNGYFDNDKIDKDLVGLSVKKYGRTTGLTRGRVTEINVTSAVCYDKCSHPFRAKLAWFDNQIAIESDSNDYAFSMGGDSGSLIVTNDANNNPVGLLFAGSSTNTLANRIDLVLNRFGVTVDDSGSDPCAIFDKDEDGYDDVLCGGLDCNDNDPAINPGALEVCNGVDDNCNGSVDEGFDTDGDGYTTCGGDCNDSDFDINPGANESLCDGEDNDCDLEIDEDYVSYTCGIGACEALSVCEGGVESCKAGSPTDEVCEDGIDNNCDSLIDEGCCLDYGAKCSSDSDCCSDDCRGKCR